MKNNIIVILLIFSITKIWGQKIEEITHREVNVHFADSSIKANVLLADKKQRLNPLTDYYWYHNNSIKNNQGDYKGRVLDGDYQVSNKDGNLIAKGKFKKGSKSDEWKEWNDNGKLTVVENWLKGFKNGKYSKYQEGILVEQGNHTKNEINGTYRKFENKKLIEKGVYRKGVLHGKKLIYKSDTIFSTTNYKKGKVVLKKEKEGETKKNENTKKEDPSKKEQTKSKSKLEKKKTPFWKKEKKDVSKESSTPEKKEKEKKVKTVKQKKLKKEKKKKQKDD
jgi:antitoxin component YwqK of YwqJK toxin-antitoxin module